MTKYFIDDEMKKRLERDFADYTTEPNTTDNSDLSEDRICYRAVPKSEVLEMGYFSDLLKEKVDWTHLNTITKGDILKREHCSDEYKILCKIGKAQYLILLDIVRIFDPSRSVTLEGGYNSYSPETIKKDIVRALDTPCNMQAIKEYDIGDSYDTIIKRTPLTQPLINFLVELEGLMYSDLTKYDRADKNFSFELFGEKYRSTMTSINFRNLIIEALRSYNITVIPSEFYNDIGYAGLATMLFNYSTYVRSFTSQVFNRLNRIAVRTASTTEELNIGKVALFNQQRVYLDKVNEDMIENNKRVFDKSEGTWNDERRKYVYDNIQYREDAGRLADELNDMYDGLSISESHVLHLLRGWYDRTIYFKDSKGGTRITKDIADKIKEFFKDNRDMFDVWEYKGCIDFKVSNNDLVRTSFNKKYGTRLQIMPILGCIKRQIKTGEIDINEKPELPQNFMNDNKTSIDELNIILKGLVPEIGTCSDLLKFIQDNPGLPKSGITSKLNLVKYNSIISKILDRMVELGLLEVFKGTEYAKRISDNGYFIKGTYSPEYEQLALNSGDCNAQAKEELISKLGMKVDYIAEGAKTEFVKSPLDLIELNKTLKDIAPSTNGIAKLLEYIENNPGKPKSVIIESLELPDTDQENFVSRVIDKLNYHNVIECYAGTTTANSLGKRVYLTSDTFDTKWWIELLNDFNENTMCLDKLQNNMAAMISIEASIADIVTQITLQDMLDSAKELNIEVRSYKDEHWYINKRNARAILLCVKRTKVKEKIAPVKFPVSLPDIVEYILKENKKPMSIEELARAAVYQLGWYYDSKHYDSMWVQMLASKRFKNDSNSFHRDFINVKWSLIDTVETESNQIECTESTQEQAKQEKPVEQPKKKSLFKRILNAIGRELVDI